MKSQDFIKLMDLIYKQRYEVVSVNLSGRPNGDDYEEETIIELVDVDDNNKVTFSSSEHDVAMFGWSLQNSVDSEGNKKIISHKDLDKYFDEIDFFIDSDNSRKKSASANVSSGKFIFEYNPQELVKEFIGSENKSSRKFLKLKKDYHEIYSHFIIVSNIVSTHNDKLKREELRYEEFYSLIDEILRNAYRKTGSPFSFYKLFKKYSGVNLDNLIKRFSEQSYHIENMMELLYSKGSMPGEKGIGFILDMYRSYCELSSDFCNSLRIAIELTTSEQEPEEHKSYLENCQIIRSNPKYKPLIDCIDPSIRHSESHSNAKIDKKNALVEIGSNKNGTFEIIKTYSYKEITDMTRALQRSLFPAFLFTFYLNELVLILIMLNSEEYYKLLLAIDNTRA